MERLTEASNTFKSVGDARRLHIPIRLQMPVTAEAGIVVEKIRCSVSPYCTEVLVEHLQCDDEEADLTNEDGCYCFSFILVAQFMVFLLGLSHNSIVDALSNLVKEKCSSDHGRHNAGKISM